MHVEVPYKEALVQEWIQSPLTSPRKCIPGIRFTLCCFIDSYPKEPCWTGDPQKSTR